MWECAQAKHNVRFLQPLEISVWFQGLFQGFHSPADPCPVGEMLQRMEGTALLSPQRCKWVLLKEDLLLQPKTWHRHPFTTLSDFNLMEPSLFKSHHSWLTSGVKILNRNVSVCNYNWISQTSPLHYIDHAMISFSSVLVGKKACYIISMNCSAESLQGQVHRREMDSMALCWQELLLAWKKYNFNLTIKHEANNFVGSETHTKHTHPSHANRKGALTQLGWRQVKVKSPCSQEMKKRLMVLGRWMPLLQSSEGGAVHKVSPGWRMTPKGCGVEMCSSSLSAQELRVCLTRNVLW